MRGAIMRAMNLSYPIDDQLSKLLESDEPSLRWKVRVNVLDEDPNSPQIAALQQEIASSDRVQSLLSLRGDDGRIVTFRNEYDKWKGAHWVLATLADIGYPSGDASLEPVRDQLLDF